MRKWGIGALAVGWGVATLLAQVPGIHTVQPGETVYAIAKEHGTTTDLILKTNPGLNPSRLHAGDKIRLPTISKSTPPGSPPASPSPNAAPTAPPAGRWIKVRKGDTLSKIARENRVTVENLRKWKMPTI